MSHYIALGSTFIPCPKSNNQTRLVLKFQIKRKPHTKRILITKENIRLSPVTDQDTTTSQSAIFYAFLQSHRQTTCYNHRQTPALVIGTNMSELSHIQLSSHRQPSSIGNSPCRSSNTISSCRSSLYRSWTRAQKRCQHMPPNFRV